MRGYYVQKIKIRVKEESKKSGLKLLFKKLRSWHLVPFSSVQLFSRVRLFVTEGIAERQASLPITNSRSSLRLTSIQSVMPPSHLILCRPLLLLPPIPPSSKVFSNESTLRMRWPLLHGKLMGEKVETVTDFILGGSKITADGDCSHKIKRHLLLGKEVMTNLDSIFKSRDIYCLQIFGSQPF